MAILQVPKGGAAVAPSRRSREFDAEWRKLTTSLEALRIAYTAYIQVLTCDI